MRTGKIPETALLLSLSFGLSFAERFVPVMVLFPIPGLKLGFANIAVMAALECCGAGSALAVVLLRPVLSYLFFGSVTGLVLSLSGGLLAFGALLLCMRGLRLYGSVFSYAGLSVVSAVFHSIGQIAAVSVVVSDGAIFGYLPVLCAASTLTGILTGAIMNAVIPRVCAARGIRRAPVDRLDEKRK